MNNLLFGIDLGGTKIEGVVLEDDCREVVRHRIDTPVQSYGATLGAIVDLVSVMEQRSGATCGRLGLGIPGSISPQTGLVRNANSTWINGKPLAKDLRTRLGRPVAIENDANCLALSEVHDGAAQGANTVFAAILGTGVGGGLIANGHLVSGAHGLGGEWGHVPLAGERRATDCYCGRVGCNETWLSGPALVRDYLAGGGGSVERVQEIVVLANAGNEIAKAALSRHLSRLARALAAIVNVIDPDVIVLGGGVSNLPGLAVDLSREIRPHVFAPRGEQVEVEIRNAKWDDSSGVRGAARLWGKEHKP